MRRSIPREDLSRDVVCRVKNVALVDGRDALAKKFPRCYVHHDFLTFLSHSPISDTILAKRLIVPRGESTAKQRPEKTLVGGEETLIANFLRS